MDKAKPDCGEPRPRREASDKPEEKNERGITFRRFFTSTKGNIFDARDYGHVCWPIGRAAK